MCACNETTKTLSLGVGREKGGKQLGEKDAKSKSRMERTIYTDKA